MLNRYIEPWQTLNGYIEPWQMLNGYIEPISFFECKSLFCCNIQADIKKNYVAKQLITLR